MRPVFLQYFHHTRIATLARNSLRSGCSQGNRYVSMKLIRITGNGSQSLHDHNTTTNTASSIFIQLELLFTVPFTTSSSLYGCYYPSCPRPPQAALASQHRTFHAQLPHRSRRPIAIAPSPPRTSFLKMKTWISHTAGMPSLPKSPPPSPLPCPRTPTCSPSRSRMTTTLTHQNWIQNWMFKLPSSIPPLLRPLLLP